MTLPPFNGMASEAAQCGLLASLVACQRPGIAVEAGTYQGHAAYFIAQALRDNGIGHLYTADPFPYDQQNVLRGLERWVTYHPVDFLEMLRQIPRVDFAYIDSSAPGPGGAALRWQHFEAVRAKLRNGGIICVDDTLGNDWDDLEGGQSARRIREMCGANFRFLRGLSIYQAP